MIKILQIVSVAAILLIVNCSNSHAFTSVINNDSTGWRAQIPRIGETVLDWVTFERTQGIWVIYPSGGYSQRAGLELGLMPVFTWSTNHNLLQNDQHRVNSLAFSANISTKKMISFKSDLEWFVTNRWQVRTQMSHTSLTDRFWQAYSQPDNNDSSIPFKSRTTLFKGEMFKQLNQALYAGFVTNVGHYHIKPASLELPLNITGASGGFISGSGFSLLFDKRDHIFYPTKGTYFRGDVIKYHQHLGSNFQFTGWLTDIRYYLQTGKPVLAFQFLMEETSGNTPFFALPHLGGSERMRGIGHARRIIDQNIWLLRTELRSNLWWRFGLATFLETGQAHHSFNPNIKDLLVSAGTGLRFRILPDEPLNIRFDIGFASNGHHGIYLSLREAF